MLRLEYECQSLFHNTDVKCPLTSSCLAIRDASPLYSLQVFAKKASEITSMLSAVRKSANQLSTRFAAGSSALSPDARFRKEGEGKVPAWEEKAEAVRNELMVAAG